MTEAIEASSPKNIMLPKIQWALPPQLFLRLVNSTTSRGPLSVYCDQMAVGVFKRMIKGSPWQFLSLSSLRYIKLPCEVERAKLVLYTHEKKIFLDFHDADNSKLLAHRVYDHIIKEFIHTEAASVRDLWRWLSGFSNSRPDKLTLRTLDNYPSLKLRDWPGANPLVSFPDWAKGQTVEVSAVTVNGKRRALFSFPKRNVTFEKVLRGEHLINVMKEETLILEPAEKGFAHHSALPDVTFIHGPRLEQPFRVRLKSQTGEITKITYNGHNERRIPFINVRNNGRAFVILNKKGVSLDQIEQKRLNMVLTDLPIAISKNERNGPIPFVVVFDRRFTLSKPERNDPMIHDTGSFSVDAHIREGHVIKLSVKRGEVPYEDHDFIAVRDYAGRMIGTSRHETPAELNDHKDGYSVECRRSFVSPNETQYLNWLGRKYPLGYFYPERRYLSFVVDRKGAILRVDIWLEPIRDPYIIMTSNGAEPRIALKDYLYKRYGGKEHPPFMSGMPIKRVFFWGNGDELIF